MGLWTKGLKRARAGELRLDEIYIPDDLLQYRYCDTYTVNTGIICKMYKELPKSKKLDISIPQFIWWSKFEYRRLSEINFAITDPSSEIYITGGTRCTSLLISNYDTNIISNRYNVKCNFIQSIKNIGRTGDYWCVNLDDKEFSNIKHVIKYISEYVLPKHNCKEQFYKWLKNKNL